ncbi:cytochrome c biogenesis protein ResB [Macrococcus brunensis]|uniref:Cytochrome c biogenesis protein ResB n=1 Tax=Macrococcus brunensis TaxID=198483 RepID=A0A4R6BDJ0_9STAP|nr:cytochrome c biogenesis protein ResB [Macrococcus brunensis]TDL97837.1 cytochrome c biogenesis protein ResB [Macrococcus brunensis]ULG73381.1 cytochrome c biogenesis protein ResB [Macrococcus brunensis]
MNEKAIVCTCGHVNPPGTQLCQNCGRLINDDYDKKKTTDIMRYDGSAVRSKTKNKTVTDKIWNFFASVKTGVILLVLTIVAAAIGSIMPQEYFIPANVDPASFYQEKYGSLGYLYHQLGLDNLYTSWWFLILLGLVAFSIIAASIDRGVPLFKSLRNQATRKHPSFLKRQRLTGELVNPDLDQLEQTLKEKRYKVKREGDALLAEKGRLSRYGPYINHTGLIILLMGGMLRFVPAMYYDGAVAVKEGDTRAIPGTDKQYYMRNDKFILEHYDQQMNSNTESTKADSAMNKIAKNYETRLTLFENTKDSIPGAEPELKEVKTGNIKVNHPFKFDHFELYQNSYDQSLLKSMTFKVIDKKTEKEIGQTFTVNLDEPAPTYKIADNLTVNLRNYAPDFDKIEANGTLATKTPNTVNPAFVFEVDKANQQPEYSLLKIRSSQDISQNNQHAIKFVSATNHTMTYLNVKKDLTLPYLFIGFTIFLLGLAIGSYINHRRIWVNGNQIAAHTSKNYFGLKNELNTILEKNNQPAIKDKYESEETK